MSHSADKLNPISECYTSSQQTMTSLRMPSFRAQNGLKYKLPNQTRIVLHMRKSRTARALNLFSYVSNLQNKYTVTQEHFR